MDGLQHLADMRVRKAVQPAGAGTHPASDVVAAGAPAQTLPIALSSDCCRDWRKQFSHNELLRESWRLIGFKLTRLQQHRF